MLKFKFVNRITVLISLCLLVGYVFFNVSIWFLLILFVIWFLLTIAGSVFIGWNYHFDSLNSNSRIAKNHVAITFDDGPHPVYTPQVLKLLEKYDAKSTFFCIGQQVESHSELFKEIINQGHTVGNHTYSHSKTFGFFGTEKTISELKKTNQIIESKTGLLVRLFRPAFGVTNPRIKRALKITKLQSIGWNKRSLDTRNITEKRILNRVTKNLKKGDIILLHDTSEKTIVILEQLLLFLQQQKIESVTIDNLFNIKAYA